MQSRSGELAMRPLPAVLLDLNEDLATGKLQLRRGRVSKSVDLVNGNPVSTASNPRDETLGHFLVSSGVITEDQHRQGVQRSAELGGKLGEALVALQILSVEQLIDQLLDAQDLECDQCLAQLAAELRRPLHALAMLVLRDHAARHEEVAERLVARVARRADRIAVDEVDALRDA